MSISTPFIRRPVATSLLTAALVLVGLAAYPFLPVEQRHYRFRLLNGSQARFYNLMLYFESKTKPGEVDTRTVTNPDGSVSIIPVGSPGPAIVQIGTEGGFLDAPVLLNSPANSARLKA